MKICILAPRFPFPENGGDVLRINNIARQLKKRGHEIILVSFGPKENKICESYEDCPYSKIYLVPKNRIASILYALVAYTIGKPLQTGHYFSFRYLCNIKRIIISEKPDLFISHLIRMVPYLKLLHLENKSIVEMTDVLSKTYLLSKVSLHWSIKKIAYSLELNRIKRYENKTANEFAKTVLVSEDDKKLLEIQSKVFVHPNGIDVRISSTRDYNSEKIVFVGNMRTLQNQDAISFFLEDVYDRVVVKVPNINLWIVGAEPPRYLYNMARGKNVRITGYVKSVEDEIIDAALSIAPLRIAAGVQNKVLISMACGIPVVLSTIASKGIPGLISGYNCIIADSGEAFASSIVSIIKDRELRDQLSAAGLAFVKESYSWEKNLLNYENL